MSDSQNEPAIRLIQVDVDPDLEKLTAREREVLVYAGKGYSNAEIAEIMNLEGHRASDAMKQVIKKLNVRNRTEAAVIACRAGWL